MAEYHTSPTKKIKHQEPSSPTSTKSDCTGYVQTDSQIQKSKTTSNYYFDVNFQVSNEETKIIRVMSRKGDSKRQLFLDKLQSQQPIILTNLPVSPSGTTFFNYSTTIRDAPPHSVNFKFRPSTNQNITKIKSLHEQYSSGYFTVSGLVQLLGSPHQATNSTKSVCDAKITDNTGSISLSVWEEHIPQVLDGQFYTISNVKLRYFHEKCLSTTTTTAVNSADRQDVSTVVAQPNENFLCCPTILNVAPTIYPACNNNQCKRKINANPGDRVLRCLNCKKSMLIDNCTIQININFNLEKHNKQISATAFRKVLSDFLQEDIYIYRDDTTPLEEKLLLLKNVDFHLSRDKVITAITHHTNKEKPPQSSNPTETAIVATSLIDKSQQSSTATEKVPQSSSTKTTPQTSSPAVITSLDDIDQETLKLLETIESTESSSSTVTTFPHDTDNKL